MNWFGRELAHTLAPAMTAIVVAAAVGTFIIFAATAPDHPFVVIFVTLFVMPLGMLVAGLGAAIFALPLYLVIRGMGYRLRWWAGVLIGVGAGAIPISYFMLPIWRMVLTAAPDPQHWTAWQAFSPLIPFLTAGAAAGFAFWWALRASEVNV